MSKILRIGDPHIKPKNMDESERLMHFIHDTILQEKPDRVEILGDLFHTHGVIHMEVLEFWDSWLDILSECTELFALVGNHDINVAKDPNERSFSSLTVFRRMRKKNLKLVELPRTDGLFAYVPYCHSHEYFIDVSNACAKEGAKVLVCHQTFNESKYESGIPALDGIDTSKLDFDLIISGHLHTEQVIEKDGKTIIYPGTPKWDTVSDANENKGIWMFHHDDETGKIISKHKISTHEVCTPIVSMVWNEGEDMPVFMDGARVSIELVGSSNWIEEKKQLLKGQVSIKTKITDRVEKKNRQPGKNFPEFVAKLFVTDMNRIELLKYMRGLGIV